jgi:hypothetical protein
MTEPVVTFTDYGLALECGLLAWLCWRRRPGPFRRWLTVFFFAAALAPLLGGTVHGFFPDETLGQRLLWTGTLLAIGVTALSGWALGGLLVLSERARHWLMVAAWVQLAVYAGVVGFISGNFAVAIIDYLPATVFLLVAFAIAWRRSRASPLAVAAAGLGLTLVAAAGQQAGIGIHPVWFDHNALYHLLQALAFLMVYRGARFLLERGSAGPGSG